MEGNVFVIPIRSVQELWLIKGLLTTSVASKIS